MPPSTNNSSSVSQFDSLFGPSFAVFGCNVVRTENVFEVSFYVLITFNLFFVLRKCFRRASLLGPDDDNTRGREYLLGVSNLGLSKLGVMSKTCFGPKQASQSAKTILGSSPV